MSRYIDADEYIARLSYYIAYLTRKYGDDSNTVERTLQTVIDEIDHLPTADVQEVQHGMWVYDNPLTDTLRCSLCGYNILAEEFQTPFCPYCGAKLDQASGDK